MSGGLRAAVPSARPNARAAGSARPARLLAAVAALAAATAAVLLGALPAQAAPKHVDAQLALSGVASADNPAGGSQLGIRPGGSVTFSAAGVPTVGLAKLGLSDLVGTVDNLLGGAASFQVRANFAGLPGGRNGTVLKGDKHARFSFPKAGTYHFTWSVQKVTVVSGLLGSQTKVTTINLNGNELRQAGIKLNAKNQYVGSVVVKKKPPQGGISIQLPSVGAHPSAPGVGNLPSVGVPGVRLPTVHTSVPNLTAPKLPSVPGLPGGGSGSSGGGSSSSSAGGGGATHFSGPPTWVPELVVPKGNNALVIPGDNNPGVLPSYNGAAGNLPAAGNGAGDAGSRAGKVHPQPLASNAAQPQPVHLADPAADAGSPSGQLPVLLAIIAIITLALVAGTYARLFLNRRNL